MILEMARLRVLGPTDLLQPTLHALQDVEAMHLAPPCEAPGCRPFAAGPAIRAERTSLARAVDDLAACRKLLGATGLRWLPARDHADALSGWPGRARELRAELEEIADKRRRLDEERALLERFDAIVQAFGPLLDRGEDALRAVHLVLPASEARVLETLRAGLSARIGDGLEVVARPLPAGELAVAILFAPSVAAEVEALLEEAALEELGAPEAYGGGSLSAALPTMRARRAAIPRERAALDETLADLARAHGGQIDAALAATHDRLAELEAVDNAARTDHAFVLEGWTPEVDVPRLTATLQRRVGPTVVIERVGLEEWAGRATPVKLRNPALFRPFETITSLLPLPAYGTLDPTPFVAIGFPMLFGIILGDLGYGVLLLAAALVLRWRSGPETTARSISSIGLACALFTAIFGLLYGELFGDLGRSWLGLRPLALDREEALMPALILAVGIGLSHVLLGLVLGAVNAARGEPHKAIGRGLAAVMVVLVLVALLAAFGVLPRGVLTPAVIGLLVAFPALVAAEGILGPVELMSTFANVLSYARIMAVGTASVMMAVVANRLAGAFGSVVVGVIFALLFHLVNFAIGVFGPAVHVLRLHYVEFFGKFYSPGGAAFRPLRHWRPTHEPPLPGG